MRLPKFSLAFLLLLVTAIPFWGIVIVVASQSPGFGGSFARYVTAPLVLSAMSLAIFRVVRGRPNAWAISLLLAGIIAFASLAIATWLLR